MKKILVIFVSILAIFAGVLFAAPIFFKNKIQKKVNQEIQKKINATVYYKDFDISLIKHFPNVTLSLSNFGIVGRSPFVGDTLVQATNFSVSADMKSILSGDKIAINFIQFDAPKIFLKVLNDGSNNYDIYKTDSLKAQQAEMNEKSNFQLEIKFWKIMNGQIIYDNRLRNSYISFQNIIHEGSGEYDQPC